MARRLSRVRARLIGREELAWRARVLARTQLQRVAAGFRPPHWDRSTLRNVLAAGVLDPAGVRALNSANWVVVQDALVSRLQQRPARFVLDYHSADTLARRVRGGWPDAAADAAKRADRILDGRYDLLAFTDLTFDTGNGRIDWHRDPVHDKRSPARFWADVPYLDPHLVGDHKIIWELNRHQHWLQLGRALWLTGESKYGNRVCDELASWMAANPPLRGINWASMLELALRSISWTWGLHFLLGTVTNSQFTIHNSRFHGPWLVDMLVGLDRQLRHVEQNLSYYFSPNTHLTGEALALYVVGLALPELAASRRWVDRGRHILLREIERQILPDGGHAERSTHYHRYTLDFYLLALIAAKRAPGEPAAQFADAVERLAGFARALADDRGILPVIGDDDGGMLWPMTGRDCRDVRDSLALAASLLRQPQLSPWGPQEEACWIGGDLLQDSPVRSVSAVSQTFPDTGYVVMRDPNGMHAVFDVGAHGYMNGGHAHADALALTIATAEQPLLIDPGTSSYTLGSRLRDRMRRSRNHNTVEIDGQPQSIPSGPFHWRTRTDARLHGRRHNPAFDWAEGWHDGFGGARHRRSVFRAGSAGWLVADEVIGSGAHSADAFWHFDPGWNIREEAQGRLCANHPSGGTAWLLHDGRSTQLFNGDDRTGLGWCAPVYGALKPTWSAQVARNEEAPFALVTWIGVSRPGLEDPACIPDLQRMLVTHDDGGPALAARVDWGDRTALFMLRPGDEPVRRGRTARLDDLQTDARALHLVRADGRLIAIDLVDATRLTIGEEVNVEIDGATPDLHIELDRATIVLSSSGPAARLTVSGKSFGELTVEPETWRSGTVVLNRAAKLPRSLRAGMARPKPSLI